MLLAAIKVVAQQHFVSPISRIDILFAGDLMQHESQLNAAKQNNGTYSYSPCYNHIREEVSMADIAIANLETTIGSTRYGGYPSFCAPDSFLYAAKGAGFDVLLFANNHCLDRGKRGAEHTLNMMDSLGIRHCGVYRDSIDRNKRYPLMLQKNGFRIALLNYTYGTNGIVSTPPMIVNYIDKDVMKKDIAKAKAMHPDAIIACMHWGEEYISLPPTHIKQLAQWLIDEGVDHVIGGHPHVLQPMLTQKNKEYPKQHAIVYSLGNLISGMYARGRDGGALAKLQLKKFCGITKLEKLQYTLTWVARPNRDNVENFIILPAATPPFLPNSGSRHKLDEFVTDSRMLFKKYNSDNIEEYYLNKR